MPGKLRQPQSVEFHVKAFINRASFQLQVDDTFILDIVTRFVASVQRSVKPQRRGDRVLI